jgi:hypothetical protein
VVACATVISAELPIALLGESAWTDETTARLMAAISVLVRI